ncbi:MAG: hypothetical protein K0R67_3037 [Paenibacillus sp.]|jgi:hypothetical protein|nr:hypothetical protein [Paenibacillus sp.]
MKKPLLLALLISAITITGCASSKEQPTASSSATASPQQTAAPPTTAAAAGTSASNTEQASFTQGPAKTINPGLLNCKGGLIAALGEISSDDGIKWIVPSDVNIKISDASDLSNPCKNVQHKSIAAVDLSKVPVIEIDPDGKLITGYIFADNYFELYINGKPVAKDAVPFTPFNSHVVQFKASYPMTYAIKVVDWEENLGLGTEENKGSSYHPGDAGIVAVFSDGTVTDSSWKAQNFYISPLANKSDLVIEVKDGKTIRSTPKASSMPSCEKKCYAAHFKVPENWYAKAFDDSKWPSATVYKTESVGVDNKSEYTNYKSEFSKGSFIWTNNLVLDNEIIIRRTVEKASK